MERSGAASMPLNEREQQILDEIERQLVEDPEFTRKASSLSRLQKRKLRLPAAGAAVGLLTMLVTFSFNTVAALAGFCLMVLSVSALVQMRRGAGWGAGGGFPRNFQQDAKKIRRRFRR